MQVSISLTISRRTKVKRSLATWNALFSALTASARREIEAIGLLDLPAPALAREPFAVRAIPPDDQTTLYEHRQVTAQRRRRHTIGALSELLIGWPDNQVAVGPELVVLMKRQERVEDRQ